MFGDLGQGLCVAAIGAFMGFKMKMAIGKVLIPCGISSAIFGFLFGSVFGFETWLDGAHQAMGMATAAGDGHKLIHTMGSSVSSWVVYGTIGLGVCLIVFAMIIGIINNLSAKRLKTLCLAPPALPG